jgi:glycosyltransferase involved in cell wall biosynthesis
MGKNEERGARRICRFQQNDKLGRAWYNQAMPIYVDVSSAVHSKAGIGRYAASLASALVQRQPERYALFYNRVAGSLPPPFLESVPRRTIGAGYKPWRMAVWAGQVARIGFDRLVPDADLFHATEHLLPCLRKAPSVLTVHDMIFKLFPEHQKRLNYWYLNATMPLYCRRAEAIITVSESSKRDIVAHYGIDPAKVNVIYEAASPEFRPVPEKVLEAVRRQYHLPERYAVFVGTIEPRKNLTRLVEALQLLHDRGVVVPLVVVGAKGWLYDGLFQRVGELEAGRSVLFPGYVPSADLPAVYAAATLAVMPSVYEGFGLPVLEAMACGTPVVSSNSSSLPELGGEAAVYFDPYEVEAMAKAILQVWSDASLQEEMGQQGLAQAASFSWARAAADTEALYDRVRGAW